jgi:hypothetical protein
MRVYRCLFAAALLCGLTGIAKADDFQMVVIDPPPVPHTDILTDTFTIAFHQCSASLAPYVGCFTGENETGHTLTSLQIFVPNAQSLSGQTVNCAAFGGGLDIFTSISCSQVTGGYLLLFSGGNIPSDSTGRDDDENPDSFFTIAEYGASADSFPRSQGRFDPVPEPDSLMLLSSGMLSGLGYMVSNRRKQRAQEA